MVHEAECPCCARTHLFLGEKHDAAQTLYFDTFTVVDPFEWESIWLAALESKDASACIQLVCAMSEVSGTYDCATWGTCIKLLPQLAKDIEGSCVETITDFCQVERKALRELLVLSAQCGGWWEWQRHQSHRSFVPGWIPPSPRPS